MIKKSGTKPTSVAIAGMAWLAMVAGCGGASSASDENPPAENVSTSDARPEIDDPAVEASALRTVDPCALLNDTTLAELGALVPDSSSSSEWGECGVEVTDASGDTVELVLRVGDNIILADDATEELEGLPLLVDDEDPESCWVSVVTSRELSLGISVQVDYVGGDGCAAGRTAMTKVVRALHAEPPRYRQVDGSLLTADPCAAADKGTVEAVLGKKTFVEATSLHECDFWSGDGTEYPKVAVRFFQGLPAEEGDGEPVDLDGVTAVRVAEEDSVTSCDVTWRHLETPSEDEADGSGELVSIMYSGEAESGLDTATACEKATEVARTVVPSLVRQ
jgi:Protein of unknown function (DUF3558)